MNRKELEAKIRAIYFEEHKDFVRRWIREHHAYFLKYDCLPPEAERKCLKITDYTSKAFYDKAKGEANE